MESAARSERGDRQDLRRFAWREPLPGDEEEQLAVLVAQSGHCPQDFGSLAIRRGMGCELGPQRFGETPPEPGPASRGPVQVGDHAACDRVEPERRLRVGRDLGEPPPGDEEGLGDDVGGVLAILNASQRVRQDRPPLLAVEPAELNLGELVAERTRLDLTLRHRLYMSGSVLPLHE